QRLEELGETVDDQEERDQVERAIAAVEALPFGKTIEKYTTRDIAQAFVGSIVFSMPFLVEDGVYEIARHLLETPVYLVANFVFVFLVAAGLLYWSDIRDVRVHRPIFGVVPRRLLGVLVVSFLTATLTMALWGRLNGTTASVAFARISVVWTAASFGAALGDILPGQSTGEDVNDVLRDLLGGN
ncbi:MAG: DUF2391 domain-containing protein, partial [Halobacteriales archaeon]